MALYAIGDVQGCLAPLERLLASIRFDEQRDRLWFVGDLVNRGPDSLGVLRVVRALGDRAVTVLGNHDLHLLAVAKGSTREKPRDTLHPILQAPDRDGLISWLQSRPLVHFDPEHNAVLVHAGLLPAWRVGEAIALAGEVEAQLRGPQCQAMLQHMYGNEPNRWDPALTGYARLRVILNGLTRVRYCYPDGRLDLHFKGAPGTQPAELVPWYALRQHDPDTRIVFGHWSTLGAGRFGNAIGLDSGCVWGGGLTAVRLEDGALFQADCPKYVSPG